MSIVDRRYPEIAGPKITVKKIGEYADAPKSPDTDESLKRLFHGLVISYPELQEAAQLAAEQIKTKRPDLAEEILTVYPGKSFNIA